MLETRRIEQHDSLCPAAYAIGETLSGSGVACRVTGNLVTTGRDPSSLTAYCWQPLSQATGTGTDGSKVGIGYQSCPVWRWKRRAELALKNELADNAPERVKDGWNKVAEGVHAA